MRSFRSKPVGWQRDNYRHYLAAKFGAAPKRFETVSRIEDADDESMDAGRTQQELMELQRMEDDARLSAESRKEYMKMAEEEMAGTGVADLSSYEFQQKKLWDAADKLRMVKRLQAKRGFMAKKMSSEEEVYWDKSPERAIKEYVDEEETVQGLSDEYDELRNTMSKRKALARMKSEYTHPDSQALIDAIGRDDLDDKMYAKKIPSLTDGYFAVEEDMRQEWGDGTPDDEKRDISLFKEDISKQVAHPMRDLDERYASMLHAKGESYVPPESMSEKFEDRMAASLASVETLGSAESLINPKRESEKPARQQMIDLMLGNTPGE